MAGSLKTAFNRIVIGSAMAGYNQLWPFGFFHTPDKIHPVQYAMRGIAVAMAALVALSVAMREHPHHAPLPTGPMPAVNVP